MSNNCKQPPRPVLEAEKIYEKLSDEELVARIVAKNNPMLFEFLYDRYSRIVYNKCYGFSKTAAEAKDLTQDVFLHLYLKLPTFKGESKFSTWLYALAYNFCVNYVNRDKERKIGDKVVDSSEAPRELSAEIKDESLFQMRSDRLKLAMQNITAEDRTILLLKYQDNIPIKELIVLLGIGESAVKMRLKRAKTRVLETYNKLP